MTDQPTTSKSFREDTIDTNTIEPDITLVPLGIKCEVIDYNQCDTATTICQSSTTTSL